MFLELVTLIFMVSFNHVACSETSDAWSPDWMPERADLKCNNYCESEHRKEGEQRWDKREYDKCCVCRSSTTWENSLEDMYIEFITVLGGSIALLEEAFLNDTYHRIAHVDSVMTSLPDNICEVPRLMVMDFSYNYITSLDGIKCAYSLDTLDLSYNKLEVVKNTSLAELTNLRIVDLSNNRITYIEPNVFTSINARFFKLDLSFNDLTTIDVTNMLGLYPYCRLDYQNNIITDIVNENGFALNLDQIYGPGFVDLKNNNIETFPDYKTLLRIEELKIIGKLFEFGFDIRGSPIICDCNMETFLELAKDIIETVWVEYHNVICIGPEKYKGKRVVDVPLNELICHLGVEDDCPVECSCIDRPSENAITVECVNALMTEMPDKLPNSKFSDKIDLNVAYNLITEIPSDLDYLHKLNNFNVSNNDLAEITDAVASMLENSTTIALTGNDRLNNLPQQFQFKSPCGLQLDGIVIECDCNMTWLPNWLSTKTCDNLSQFDCYVEGHGLLNVREFRKDMLTCITDSEELIKRIVIGLSVTLFTIIFTAATAYVLRYEILVIYTRAFKQFLMGKQDSVGVAGIQNHVFISFDDRDRSLCNWVMQLQNYLKNNGYGVHVPIADTLLGVRDEETIKEMNKCACVLIILNVTYVNELSRDDGTEDSERPCFENEWKYAWNKFSSNRSKRLIIVNFDHISPGGISNRRLKAYLRVGRVIGFTNAERNIMTVIEHELKHCSTQRLVKVCPLPNGEHVFDIDRSEKASRANMQITNLSDTCESDEVIARLFEVGGGAAPHNVAKPPVSHRYECPMTVSKVA